MKKVTASDWKITSWFKESEDLRRQQAAAHDAAMKKHYKQRVSQRHAQH